jgi:hypothetical protein
MKNGGVMLTFSEFSMLHEAAYKGNIGVMEVIKFRKNATPEQINQFHDHIDKKEHEKAWKLVQKVTGVKLHSSVMK